MQYDLTSVLYVRTNEVYLPVTDLTMAGYSNSTPKPIKAGHQKNNKRRNIEIDRETEKQRNTKNYYCYCYIIIQQVHHVHGINKIQSCQHIF